MRWLRSRRSGPATAAPAILIVEDPRAGAGLGLPAAIALVEWLGQAGHAPRFVLDARDAGMSLLSAFAPVHPVRKPAEGLAQAAAAGAGVVLLAGWSGRRTRAVASLRLCARRTGGSDRVRLDISETGGRMEGVLAALPTGMDWHGLPVLAFAGAGCDLLCLALQAEGAQLLRRVQLDGRGALPARLCARLEAEARARGAQLVTAEADTPRLPPALRRNVLAMPLRLLIDDWSPLAAALERAAERDG